MHTCEVFGFVYYLLVILAFLVANFALAAAKKLLQLIILPQLLSPVLDRLLHCHADFLKASQILPNTAFTPRTIFVMKNTSQTGYSSKKSQETHSLLLVICYSDDCSLYKSVGEKTEPEETHTPVCIHTYTPTEKEEGGGQATEMDERQT